MLHWNLELEDPSKWGFIVTYKAEVLRKVPHPTV